MFRFELALLVALLGVLCALGQDPPIPPSQHPRGPWVDATRGEPWPKPQSVENHDEGFMVVRPSTFNFKAPPSGWWGTPRTVATRGEPWPKPQSTVNHAGGFLIVRPSVFSFKVTGQDCDLLEDAMKRYFKLVKNHVSKNRQGLSEHQMSRALKSWRKNKDFRGYLDSLDVDLKFPCEQYPHLDMDERYQLKVDSPDLIGAASLTSDSIWGILRGLETFSQLLHLDDSGAALAINSSTITDFPRFPHRGLLLDTARHFFPLPYILRMLDALEYNKMNVLHWHIVDDSAFPYQSSKFPQLSALGAYHPQLEVYSRLDVKEVIEYARLRGIRVIPEFDTPGHTYSWYAIPDLLTPCYTGDELNGKVGPMNPILESTYTFVKELFAEIVELFPEKYFHLGGDEVPFDCWESNPDIKRFMEMKNISGNFGALEEIYVQQAVDIAASLNASAVVWQEVLDNGVNIQPDTVVHVWTLDMAVELEKVTSKGYKALLSTCWYLDHLATGGDWKKFYQCEPHNFTGTPAQKSLVMGGEACMWSEYVDTSNLEPRVWPRASAVAERLWSSVDVVDTVEAARRLEEHWCRMKRRGIAAQPVNGPGYCAE